MKFVKVRKTSNVSQSVRIFIGRPLSVGIIVAKFFDLQGGADCSAL